MDQRPKLKAKTLKGNMRVNFITLDLTKDSYIWHKAQATKEIVRCHQNLKFCASKDTIKKVERNNNNNK